MVGWRVRALRRARRGCGGARLPIVVRLFAGRTRAGAGGRANLAPHYPAIRISAAYTRSGVALLPLHWRGSGSRRSVGFPEVSPRPARSLWHRATGAVGLSGLCVLLSRAASCNRVVPARECDLRVGEAFAPQDRGRTRLVVLVAAQHFNGEPELGRGHVSAFSAGRVAGSGVKSWRAGEEGRGFEGGCARSTQAFASAQTKPRRRGSGSKLAASPSRRQ